MANENIEKSSESKISGFFDTLEMKEIIDFIEKENQKSLASEKIDQIADAWSKVERKKLYNN